MNTQFKLQTFDKHQGWQTLETFAHLTDADAREHEIQESFTEQGLDVKTRVQRKPDTAQREIRDTTGNILSPGQYGYEEQLAKSKPEIAQGKLAGMTKRQERNHFLVLERDFPPIETPTKAAQS